MTPSACQSVQVIGGALNALTPLGSSHGGLPAAIAISRPGSHATTPELRELRYFAVAARTGNLGRAAQELNVTASAISQQLRKLEDELGTQLLIRHGRGVTATQAGTRLLERVDTILRLLNAPLEPERAAAEPGGTVSLAIPAELGAVLAAPLMAEMRRRQPDVVLDLKENGTGGIEALLGGSVDIAMLQNPPDLDDLRIERLLTEALGLVASPRDALARSSQPLRLRELAQVPLILPNPRHWIRRLLARTGFQRGVRFDAVSQVDSVAMTKEMVRNGLGCTILPAAAVRDEVARGALVFRPLEQPALAVTHAIAWQRAAPPMVRDVAVAISDVVRSLATGGTWPGVHLVRPPAPPACVEPAGDMPPPTWRLARPEPSRGALEFVEGD